jgi:pilus assembly protein CpaB
VTRAAAGEGQNESDAYPYSRGRAVCGGLAAFLARGLIGGGQNEAEAAPNMQLTEILVAAHAMEVGTKIMPGDLKWQGWPKSALDPSFVTKEAQPQALEEAAETSVSRMALVAGEPVTAQKVIKADGAGFLAAVLTPGKRAVGVKLTAERGAGGFILPNDRVDVIMTRKAGTSGASAQYRAATVLRDVRVLAIDQTAQEEGDAKAMVGKTATLELSTQQVEVLALAEAMGDLSLSLRSLTNADQPGDDEDISKAFGEEEDKGNEIRVLRYGIASSITSQSSSNDSEE